MNSGFRALFAYELPRAQDSFSPFLFFGHSHEAVDWIEYRPPVYLNSF